MNPETPIFEGAPAKEAAEPVLMPAAASADLPPEAPYRGLRWIFIGSQGLRGGWSILIFAVLFLLITMIVGFIFSKVHRAGLGGGIITPPKFIYSELVVVLAVLGAAWIVAFIERRRLLDFNLTGPRRVPHFFSGIIAGFAALSLLAGMLTAGGWLHFGGVALSGAAVARYGLLWAVAFLLVGCAEEGITRCYLQFTLTRSINFWWALGAVAAICLYLKLSVQGTGVWGVYAAAALGVLPCLYMHLKPAPDSGFWQAAWVTSTLFGLAHISNNGENWIGIFAAAAIGFVFCVSIRVTGSAWWAIGCHAGWDWAETYFYGTADSGVVAPGHLLNTMATGRPFWSGGTDGPEGSILVLGVIASLLVWLLLAYGRKAAPALSVAATSDLSA